MGERRGAVADLVAEGDAEVGLALVDLWMCGSGEALQRGRTARRARTSASRCSETTLG